MPIFINCTFMTIIVSFISLEQFLYFHCCGLGWDKKHFFQFRILTVLFSGYLWSKVSKTVFKKFLWPPLPGATVFLARKSKGGTLVRKKYFLKIFRGLLVSNERYWLADSKTAGIFPLWCFFPEIFQKMWWKMAKMTKLSKNDSFWCIFADFSG